MGPFPWHLLTLSYFPQIVLALVLFLGVLWMVHVRIRNASLADVGFCVGFGVVVVLCGVDSEGSPWRRWLISGMGFLYALRLVWHLLSNRVWKKVEDSRYAKIRKVLGSWESIGFLGYFVLQVPACLFFAALPCWVMAHPYAALRGWDLLGFGIFGVAFCGEALADRQLEQFRSNPDNRGKVFTQGLWRFSRHPNYFFEILHWCAYVPFAVGLSWSWVAFIWPMIMMASLLWITGVPWAEAQALDNRGDAYRLYQQTTNRIIPWAPRRKNLKEE